MREYTEEERYNNYLRLLETIQFLKNEERVTEDWMEEQKDFIHEIYEMFEDKLYDVSPDIEDDEFREAAMNAHNLLMLLLDSIHTYKIFDLEDYLNFSENILSMVQFSNDQEDFEKLFSSMKLKEG